MTRRWGGRSCGRVRPRVGGGSGAHEDRRQQSQQFCLRERRRLRIDARVHTHGRQRAPPTGCRWNMVGAMPLWRRWLPVRGRRWLAQIAHTKKESEASRSASFRRDF